MLSEQDAQVAKDFAVWKRDETVDNTLYCPSCKKYYDYRIFMVHTCSPVEPAVEYIPTV
jgi:hypothetical protein